MARLPYSRVVNVTLTRADAFPGTRGFGVGLLLTNVAVNGVLDASNRTKVYANMEEVVVDHASSTEVYKALEAVFSQNPRPIQVKVGYVNVVVTGTPSNAATLKTQLDAIYDADNEWYWVGIVAPMRDLAMLDGLVEWVQAKNKFAVIDSNDVGHQTVGNTTCISARHKGTVDRTAVMYHTDAAEYAGFAWACRLGTYNFDDAGTAYTGKFKQLRSVTPVNLGSAAVQAITGFTPGLGQATSTGHCANTYVDIGGRDFVVEGSTLTENVFVDEIHATDWIIARTEEQALGILLNNDRIPFTDAGMEQLTAAARTVMRMADRAGLIANDLDPETGLYAPAVVFNVPSVFDVPASQRKARIAPAIEVTFRYAGAVHYTTINYTMTF